MTCTYLISSFPRMRESRPQWLDLLRRYNLDKLEILSIKKELRDNIKTLSLIKDDLKQIYTSMSAHQAKDRTLIINSRKNVENIEGIWIYIEGSLEQVLLMKKDKISYEYFTMDYRPFSWNCRLPSGDYPDSPYPPWTPSSGWLKRLSANHGR